MSLSRLALRLAAVEALRPFAGAPWPTWAGDRVYDSSITPISDADGWNAFVAEVEGRPLITVYTEEQDTSPVTDDYPAEIEVVDLVIEIMIAVGAVVTVPGPDGQDIEVGEIQAPISSPQHEAMLDMIEQQVRNLLDPQSAVCPFIYTRVARELHHVKSVPLRDATDRLSRQAARTLHLKTRIVHTEPNQVADAADDPVIANLPPPLLTVARLLDPNSDGGLLLRALASGQPPPPAATPLQDIHIYSGLDRGATPTADSADLASDVPL